MRLAVAVLDYFGLFTNDDKGNVLQKVFARVQAEERKFGYFAIAKITNTVIKHPPHLKTYAQSSNPFRAHTFLKVCD